MTHRRYILAFTLLIAVAVAWAPGSVAAGHGLVELGQHTDFGTGGESSPQDLTNITINGTGDTAHLANGEITGTWDNYSATGASLQHTQPISVGGEYEPTDGSGGNPTLEITGSRDRQDSWSGSERSVTIGSPSETLLDSHPEHATYLWIHLKDSFDTGGMDVDVYLNKGDTRDGSASGTKVATITTPTHNDYTWKAIDISDQDFSDASNVTIEFKTNSNQYMFYDDVDLSTPPPQGLTVNADDGASASFGSFSHGETKTNSIDLSTSATQLTFDESNGSVDYTLTMEEQHFNYRDSGAYVSANYTSVSNTDAGYVDFSQLSDVEATVTWEYWDGSSWQPLASQSYTTSGNKSLTWDASGEETVRVRVDYTATGSNPRMQVEDDTLLFESKAPTASNLQPTGGSKLSSSDTTFSVDVSDPDFGTRQSDSVTATLYIDGSQAYQTSVSSNQTVSTSQTLSEGGEHDYYWTLTDSYGETTTTSTQTVSVPSELYIYNESDPSQLLNTSVTVEVSIYQEDEDRVFTETTTDGTADLAGVDVSKPIIVRVSAADYHDRTIIIDSIYDTQNIYLLNTSIPSVENQFVLDDLSGLFGEETKLIIQRPLNVSGNTSYTRIVAAEFGVNGHTTTLESNVRYRILVQSDDRERVVGSYIARDPGPITLEVGSIVYPQPDSSGVGYEATEVESGGSEQIKVLYNDTANQTESVTVTIYERGNTSNVLTTYTSNTAQSFVFTEPVADNETSYVVHIEADRGDTTLDTRIPLGGQYEVPVPMDGQWLGTIALVALVFLTALYQSRLATVGSVIVVLAAGSLMLFQVITINPMSWWAAAAIAVGGHIRATAGGGGGV